MAREVRVPGDDGGKGSAPQVGCSIGPRTLPPRGNARTGENNLGRDALDFSALPPARKR